MFHGISFIWIVVTGPGQTTGYKPHGFALLQHPARNYTNLAAMLSSGPVQRNIPEIAGYFQHGNRPLRMLSFHEQAAVKFFLCRLFKNAQMQGARQL